MKSESLKLKQASAVLQVRPKELQNLVQFGVVKPKRSEGTYVFDASALLTAKVAFYLKESLGTRSSVLSKLMDAFSASEEELKSENPSYVVFKFWLFAEQEPLKLGVPFRSLSEQIEERLGRAGLYRDLPRGRKRRGWKKEFLGALREAAKDIGDISEEEILRTVRTYRKERRTPEITVAAEA
ncbi:MAG: MerR family transcriptional regulator [Candidatus Acidiferrum sp.]